jgi:hypothetical protein
MIKKLFYATLALSSLYTSSCFAQVRDSLMAQNRKYNYEAGIDVSQLMKGTPGTALLLKVKKKSKLVSLTFSENYRFQLAISGAVTAASQMTELDSLHYHYFYKPNNSFAFHPQVGIEKIRYFGKFNLYYGWDAGLSYSTVSNGYSSEIVSSGANYVYVYNYSSQKSMGANVTPFAGVKYRLTDRFSMSVESGFNVAYLFTDQVISNLQWSGYAYSLVPGMELKSHGFSFNMAYLRFLTFNYHFS